MNAIETIIARYRTAHPERAGAYTVEWVVNQCAALGQTPAEYLADLERDEAQRIVARAEVEARGGQDAPWVEALKASDPEQYARTLGKFTGPVDRAMGDA